MIIKSLYIKRKKSACWLKLEFELALCDFVYHITIEILFENKTMFTSQSQFSVVGAPSFICSTCKVTYGSSELQRAHYRSEWQ